MNKGNAFINVRVVYNPHVLRLLCVLKQVVLNFPDALVVLDVLVVNGVDSHHFAPDCKSLLVVERVLHADQKWNALSPVLADQFSDKCGIQVNSFDNEGFVVCHVLVTHRPQMFLYFLTLHVIP